MIKYSEFSPTPLDPDGLGLDDLQDWYVAPCSQTRDSDCLTRSNYESQLEILREAAEQEPDVDTWEEHRFGHWGPGWFEIVLVRPDSAAFAAMVELEAALSDYPVVNDEHHSQLEYDAVGETWDCMDLAERVEACQESGESVFSARRDFPEGEAFDLIYQNNQSNGV